MNEKDLLFLSIELSFESLARSRAIMSVLDPEQKKKYKEAYEKEAAILANHLSQRLFLKDFEPLLQTTSQLRLLPDD